MQHLQQAFPMLHLSGESSWSYLDNAATTQTPQCVADAIQRYYTSYRANVQRSAHGLAAEGETSVAQVRTQVARFLHAAHTEEIIFTAGTTAALNLLAWSYGEDHIKQGDEILVSAMEHHSNWLPWQLLCERKRATLRVIPITPAGELDQQAFARSLNPRTKLVAITYVSNVLGTINPLKAMIDKAHEHSAVVVVDAAQAAGHLPLDVQSLGCDFLAFSSHKMYGPTGLGILYGLKKHLASIRPYQVGGGMVQQVKLSHITYEKLPHYLEAGTPHISGIIGLGAAITFLTGLGYDTIQHHEADLLTYTIDALRSLQGLHILGKPSRRLGIISFTMNGMHPLDIGLKLDAMGIAVRTGAHCAQPLMEALGIRGTVRVSLGVYNTREDIDRLRAALVNIRLAART